MPDIRQPLTEDDIALYEIVTNRAVFGEFVRSSPEAPPDKQWKWWPKQIREMNREDPHKKRFQGRNLGKTLTCMDEMNSMVLLYDGLENGMALIGTRAQPNMQPIFEAQASLWQYNRFLKHFLNPDPKRAVDRKSLEIRLFRNSEVIIKGRIQGKDGQGFNTVHPNICAWIDEAQFIDQKAIAEFYGMISGELPLLASGVPNGWRMSWAYQIDNEPAWGFVGDKVTRLEDPRATPEWIESLARTYGGVGSNLYKQKVLGEWGAATTMTFNMDLITFDLEHSPPVLPDWYHTAIIDAGNYHNRVDLYGLFGLKEWLPIKRIGEVLIHADHGISGSPTTGYVSFFDAEEHCWRQLLRFLAYGMQQTEQVEIFDFLANELTRITGKTPWIGLDVTNYGGLAVASVLEEKGHSVHRAHFSEKVKFEKRPENQEEINKRLEKDPWGSSDPKWVDQEVPLKQVAIPVLIREMYSGKLRVVADDDIVAQLNATTNTEGQNQQQKYETDYTKDESPMYNHDLQAFEVLGAMLHNIEFRTKPVGKAKMWSHPIELGWGTEDPYEPYNPFIR